MKIQFTVAKCTKTQKGLHVLTLKYKEHTTLFGQPKEVTRTVYVGGMPAAVAVNTVLEEDSANFYIQEYPTAMVTDAQGNVSFMNVEDAVKNGVDHEQLNLKWLHVRTAVEKNVTINKAAA